MFAPGLVCEIPVLAAYLLFGRAVYLVIPLGFIYAVGAYTVAKKGVRGVLTVVEFRIRNVEQALVLSPLAFLILYHLAVIWGYAKK
jgi:hypothetical protein